MRLYAIGDLHLFLTDKQCKPMDIFGDNWLNHSESIRENWRAEDGDVTVLAGDTSWAKDFTELAPDFAFIDSLPGKKLIIKGNHDYWWESLTKMRRFAENYPSIDFIHNNSYIIGNISVCGTRGWIAEPDEPHDEKILRREVGRLRTSLQSAEAGEKIVFLHYPPVFHGVRCDEIISVLKEFSVKRCYYGHLHGKAMKYAVTGVEDGIEYSLISADHLGFTPAVII